MSAFRFILSRLSSQKWFVCAALLLTTAQCLLELRLPMLMADVVNTGMMTGSLQQITSLGLKMFLTCIAMGAFGYGASLICASIGQRFALDLRCELYDRICDLSVEQVSDFRPGSLITRLTTDIDICSGFVFSLIMLVVEPLILMIGGIWMMWRIAPALGLVFVVFIALQLISMGFFIRSTSSGFMKMRKMIDTMNSHLQNSFSVFRLMKAFGAREAETARFSETNSAVFDASYAVHMKLAVFNPLIMLIMDFAVAGILYVSGRQVAAGAVSVGAVLSAISYAEQVLLSITAGGRVFRAAAETKPSAERILDVLGTESGLKDGNLSFADEFHELSMNHVRFAYAEGTQVFDDLNFQIHEGEMISVVGTVGSGKTTLAGLCARLFDPAEGSVLLDGLDIRSLKIADVRRTIALVEKQSAVMEGTVYENIVFGRENISEESIQRAVEAAQMNDYLTKNMDGLNTFLLSMGKNLSGGERQRLSIARALAGNPGLLVLDDSTSSMDYETEKRLLHALREQYPKMAVILTTNRLPSALRADRILVLDNGRIADEGPDSELRERCELYRRMCAAQDMR